MTYIVPSIHPAFVARSNRRYSGVLKHDFARAAALTNGWRPTWKDMNFKFKPSIVDVVNFCKRAIDQRLTVTYDSETDGRDHLICDVRCLGLYDGTDGICIPLLWRQNVVDKKATWHEFYDGDSRARIIAALSKCLTSRRVTTVAQNGQYDRLVCKHRLGFLPDLSADTILMHHVAQSYLPHGLDFLASIYTDITYYKKTDEGEAWSTVDDNELWLYNLRDCKVTWLAYQQLKKDLPASYPNALKIYEFDQRMGALCESMKETGILVDKGMLAFLRHWYGEREQRALNKMRELIMQVGVKRTDFVDLLDCFKGADDDDNVTGAGLFRPGSLAELRHVFAFLKVPLTALTETGLLSTAKDFLLEARTQLLEEGAGKNDPRIAFLDYLFAWRSAGKLVSTFLKEDMVLSDGRVHPTYNPFVTPTGRLSSSADNIQNRPKEIRSIYVAQPGHSIVAADWDQGEARLAGYLSNEPVLCNGFAAYDAGKGPKIHKINASIIYGVPMDKVTPPIYTAAKRFLYGALYGAGPKTIWETCRKDDPDLSFGATVKCYENMKRGMPGLIAWQRRLVQQGTQQRYLESPVLGRRAWFFEQAFGEDSPEAAAMLNFPEQSGLSDIVGLANFRLQDDVLPKFSGIRQILQVHDEIGFEVLDRDAEKFGKEYKCVAEIPALKTTHKHMPVDLKISKRWAEVGAGLPEAEQQKMAEAWGKWQQTR